MLPSLRTRRPCTGVKIPQNRGKRGFGVEKPPFEFPQTLLENGQFESEDPPFLYKAPQGKKGFPDSNRPFPGWWDMGVFRPRNPLFPILGILTPVL